MQAAGTERFQTFWPDEPPIEIDAALAQAIQDGMDKPVRIHFDDRDPFEGTLKRFDAPEGVIVVYPVSKKGVATRTGMAIEHSRIQKLEILDS